MIRPAKFGDLPALIDLYGEMYAKSIYAGRGKVVDTLARGLLMQSIQRHGMKTAGGTATFVAESAGKVEGVIVGILQRVYHVGSLLTATDMIWYHSDRGEAEGLALGDALVDWAEDNCQVAEILICPNDAIGDHRRLEPWLERKGFARHGSMMLRRVR